MHRIALISVSCLLLWCPPAAGQGQPTYVDVFTSGTEGYNTFRIPSLTVAPDGSLVAIVEGRVDNPADPGGGEVHLVYKRSTDGGLSWSALQLLDRYPVPGGGSSNATTVIDRSNGVIWLLYNRWEPGYGTMASEPGTMNCQSWARYSIDSGATWSDSIDITAQTRDYDNWGAIFFGPGSGIQAADGRLIVPAAMKPGGAADLPRMKSYVVYSDNRGGTWQRGGLMTGDTNEHQIVGLTDDVILMDARQYDWLPDGSLSEYRVLSLSADGGETWSSPFNGQRVTPVMTSIQQYTTVSAGDDRDRILWTGPNGPGRNDLVVRASYDQGMTYTDERHIYAGMAAYSHMAVLQDRCIGVLWERGEVSTPYEFVTFSRFGLGFIDRDHAGDLNADGFTGQSDLDIVLANWGHATPSYDPRADASGDGYVGQIDLSVVLDHWGQGTQPTESVPEPLAMALLALGAMALIRRR